MNNLHTLSIFATDAWRYILLLVGFGFVIFFHELGHFLAAKYAGVPVEQFAVGFGPAILAYRRGVGVRMGTTNPEVERRVDEHLKAIGQENPLNSWQLGKVMEELGLGETEYRWNWLPLGGYVKMLGQDDLNPDAQSSDPRAYNNKPIRKRMIIVSAGVVMNVLLAAIGFMIVFLMGFRAPPAEIGGVLIDSPAAYAERADGSRCPLVVGDRILSIDGKPQADFTKVALTVALLEEGQSIPIVVRHHDGEVETLYVTPKKPVDDPTGVLAVGVMPAVELRGIDASDDSEDDLSDHLLFPADLQFVKPGETITAIDGQPVDSTGISDGSWTLEQAAANSDGRPIQVTIRGTDGSLRQESVLPHFQATFGPKDDLSFAGMIPGTSVAFVLPKSPARGQILPGDVIKVLSTADGHILATEPARQTLRDLVNDAGQKQQGLIVTVERNGKALQIGPIVPSVPLDENRLGLGIQLDYDDQNAFVSDVQPTSSAAKAGIQPGWRITRLNDQPVSNWFQVRSVLAAAGPGQTISVDAITPDGPKKLSMTVAQSETDAMRFMTFSDDLLSVLHERVELRKTSNPLVAAVWGVQETRDFIVQFYLTIRRMIGGSVSYKQAMGPVGILRFGAKFAGRGMDWLIWFLSMMSANLAVVNFLPIPIVDGGLFTLLIIEKVKGKPLSMDTQKVIQIIGLTLILGVFLLVTYQDIARWLGRG
jgi:regulator of sigma E protease